MIESHRRTNGGHGGSRSLGQRIDRVSGSAQQAWSSTREAVSELRDRMDLPGRVQRHPYGMLAAALGVGYVLGGGLFSRLTAQILGLGLRIGVRMAAVPFLKDEVLGLVESVASGEDAGETTKQAKQGGGS